MEQEIFQSQKEHRVLNEAVVLNKEFHPLKKEECRTKLYGLRVLETICNKTGDNFLNYKVYETPFDFSITDFTNINKGRLLIRTDPKRDNYTQTRMEWSMMPRLIIDLSTLSFEQLESDVRNEMRNLLKKGRLLLPPLRFIVHKLRNLEDYDKIIQVNSWQKDRGLIKVVDTNRLDDKELFRGGSNDVDAYIDFQITDRGKCVVKIGKGELDSVLREKILTTVEEIVVCMQRNGHQWFEVSSVTYKSAPLKPEYYDLRFLGYEGF